MQISNAVLGVHLAAAVKRSTIGVMLHHAVMEPTDQAALREFFKLLKQRCDVKCLPMRALIASCLYRVNRYCPRTMNWSKVRVARFCWEQRDRLVLWC